MTLMSPNYNIMSYSFIQMPKSRDQHSPCVLIYDYKGKACFSIKNVETATEATLLFYTRHLKKAMKHIVTAWCNARYHIPNIHEVLVITCMFHEYVKCRKFSYQQPMINLQSNDGTYYSMKALIDQGLNSH